jgi:hypothetical protein
MVQRKLIRISTIGNLIEILLKNFRPQRSVLDISIVRFVHGEKKVKHFTWLSECLKHDAQYVYQCLWVYYFM